MTIRKKGKAHHAQLAAIPDFPSQTPCFRRNEHPPSTPPADIPDPKKFFEEFRERPEIKRALARKGRGWGHYYDLY